MSTQASVSSTGCRPEAARGRWFFLAVIAAMIGVIAYKHGIAFFVPWLYRPPDFPSIVIHVHVAVVAAWMLVLLVQVLLGWTGRVGWHRRFGVAGVVLAGLMFVLGILATADMVHREPGSLAGSIVPTSQIVSFTVFAGLAFWKRREREAHRRLILLAMVDPIFGVLVPYSHNLLGSADRWLNLSWVLLILLAVYDLWTRHRLHPATVWGSVALIVVQDVRVPLGHTAQWMAVAEWMRSWCV